MQPHAGAHTHTHIHRHSLSGDIEALKAQITALNHSALTLVCSLRHRRKAQTLTKQFSVSTWTLSSPIWSVQNLHRLNIASHIISPSLSLVTIIVPESGWFDDCWLPRKHMNTIGELLCDMIPMYDILSKFQQHWNLSEHVCPLWAVLTVWNAKAHIELLANIKLSPKLKSAWS